MILPSFEGLTYTRTRTYVCFAVEVAKSQPRNLR